MSLSVLLVLVAGGIAGIGILLHLLGLSEKRLFQDEQTVRRIWLAEYPGQVPTLIQISRNQHSALVTTPLGVGLVWSMGVDGAARLLLGAQVQASRAGLTVDLPDFTAPRIRLKLDTEEARQWRAAIEEAQ
jgi:hypothetical protein